MTNSNKWLIVRFVDPVPLAAVNALCLCREVHRLVQNIDNKVFLHIKLTHEAFPEIHPGNCVPMISAEQLPDVVAGKLFVNADPRRPAKMLSYCEYCGVLVKDPWAHGDGVCNGKKKEAKQEIPPSHCGKVLEGYEDQEILYHKPIKFREFL